MQLNFILHSELLSVAYGDIQIRNGSSPMQYPFGIDNQAYLKCQGQAEQDVLRVRHV